MLGSLGPWALRLPQGGSGRFERRRRRNFERRRRKFERRRRNGGDSVRRNRASWRAGREVEHVSVGVNGQELRPGEAVGHEHLTEFYWAVEQVLAPDGILVMEAITTTEERYENYLRTTDFINTIIFPGSCCPCLHALVDAAYKGSRLTLEHIDKAMELELAYARDVLPSGILGLNSEMFL